MNGIKNASGLDGVTDWTGAVSADEETVGAEGRIVIVGGGTIRSALVAVVAGQVIEAAGLVESSGNGSATLEVEFLNVAAGVVSTPIVPLKTYGDRNPRRGLPSTFDIRRGRLTVPVGAVSARLKATAAAGVVYLLKPMIETTPRKGGETPWTPGPHTNPDLDLPAWPSSLPPLEADNTDLEPIPLRKAFTSDAGVPITRRMGSTPRWKMQSELRLTMEEADTFAAFFEAGSEPFWIVRYDTQELCRAYWLADGEPTYSGARLGKRAVSFGLLVEVS